MERLLVERSLPQLFEENIEEEKEIEEEELNPIKRRERKEEGKRENRGKLTVISFPSSPCPGV